MSVQSQMVGVQVSVMRHNGQLDNTSYAHAYSSYIKSTYNNIIIKMEGKRSSHSLNIVFRRFISYSYITACTRLDTGDYNTCARPAGALLILLQHTMGFTDVYGRVSG